MKPWFILFGIIIMLPLVSSQLSIGIEIEDALAGGVNLAPTVELAPPPTTLPSNISTINTNSSNFWDDLDTPQDIVGVFLNLSGTNADQDIDVSPFTIIAGLFSGVFDWVTDTSLLIFNGTVLSFNDTVLNDTIDSRLLWNQTNSSLHPSDISSRVGIRKTTPNGSLEVSGSQSDLVIQQCQLAVACYRFETTEGGNLAVDVSRFRNFAPISGATRVASKGTNGTGSFSLEFDGDDFVHANSENQIEFTDRFSLGGWIFPDTAQQQYIVSKVHNGTNGYALLMASSRRIIFIVERDGTTISQSTTTSVTLNEWTHIVGTINASDILIYFDGVSQGLTTTPITIAGVSTDVFIGINSEIDDGWSGRLDEIGLINETILATDALNVSNNGFNLIDFNFTALDISPFQVSGVNNTGDIITIDRFGRIGLGKDNPSVRFEVNGTSRFYQDVIVDEDIFIAGTIVGASPVKISGGLNVVSGGLDIIGNSTINSTLTIADYLLFKFSEGFSNLIDGWINVIGNLNVSGDTTLSSLNVSKNITTQGIVLGGDTTNHRIFDNSTCIITKGDTSTLFIC